jgi:CelD/BcsL family acetyltransferase involved in cellulose biosynthesis
MQISVVRPFELGETELRQWREFQCATPSLDHPMLAPEFTIVVGRHRPRSRVAVLCDGAQTVGFFPFERRRLGHGSPIATNLTGCQGLVHAPGAEWDPDQLLRACGLAVWEFDCLVDDQGPFQRYVDIRVPSPIMDFSQGWEHYWQELRHRSPNTFKKVPQKTRKLGRDVGEVTFVPDTADPTALRSLMRWKSEQYRRTGRSDRLTWRGVPEILEQLLATRSAGFQAILSATYAGDRLVSVTYTLRSPATAKGWHAAYNPEFARYSPGLAAYLAVGEAMARDGARELHMGRGTRDAYKQMLKSRDLLVGEGRVARRTPLGAAHWARSASTRRIRYAVTESPPLLKAADRTLNRAGHLRTSLNRRMGRATTASLPVDDIR